MWHNAFVHNNSPFQLLGLILLFIFIGLLGLVGWAAMYPTAKDNLNLNSSFTQLKAPAFLNQPDYLPAPVTMEQVLATDHSWTATLSAEKTTRVLATGDVLLARTVNKRTVTDNNYLWPWEKTAEVLKTADITFINLETPLIKDCPIVLGGFTFCGNQRHVEGLKYGGVDVINLANNHAGNYGHEGVDETLELLLANEFLVSGVGGPTYLEVNDQTFAFLGFNEVDVQPGVTLAEYDIVADQVAEASANADVVIVQFHWGTEYVYQPTTNQQRLAHIAIDNGADVIIGNHPHWFQALEQYQDKFITYSHGNFIFDQMWSPETRQGMVGRYTFYEDKLVDVEFMPVLIEDFGQPRWLEGESKQQLLNTLQTETNKLKATSENPVREPL